MLCREPSNRCSVAETTIQQQTGRGGSRTDTPSSIDITRADPGPGHPKESHGGGGMTQKLEDELPEDPWHKDNAGILILKDGLIKIICFFSMYQIETHSKNGLI